ncbi:hypothetical protein HK096_002941 [Nowakowskiella sp. JEL0078]|nr:hypothetical protein HK096_002941 [Nowakowskiella sp. JEL0078]
MTELINSTDENGWSDSDLNEPNGRFLVAFSDEHTSVEEISTVDDYESRVMGFTLFQFLIEESLDDQAIENEEGITVEPSGTSNPPKIRKKGTWI